MYQVTLVNGSRQRIVAQRGCPRVGEVIFVAREPWMVTRIEFWIGGA